MFLVNILCRKLPLVALVPIIYVLSLAETNAQVLTGKVISSKTKDPIPFANVTIPRTDSSLPRIGVSANEQGDFRIALSSPPPFKLEFSAVGYVTKQVTFDTYANKVVIELDDDLKILEGVTVQNEKLSQKELERPQDVAKLSLVEIQNTPSFNYFDALANLKGVDMTTESVVINNVNTRGFGSTDNKRFKVFTDGVDNEAPGPNFALGNVLGPNSLDVESIELIPGPSSALFGPSIFNGLVNMITKSPFDYQGLSVSAKGVTAAIDTENRKAIHLGNFISDLSGRYAFSVKDRVAIKVAASHLVGSDFRARNYLNVGPGYGEDEYSHLNQSIDRVNVYGDDRSFLLVVPRFFGRDNTPNYDGPDTAFFVTREGYREENLVDYQSRRTKINAEIQFKLTQKLLLSLSTFRVNFNGMITGIDRISLRNFELNQHKFELRNNRFLIRAYTTHQDAGNTYNAGLLGDIIVKTAKPDAVWFDQYRRLYLGGRIGPEGRFQAARRLADTGFPGNQYLNRFTPETASFDSLKSVITKSYDSRTGAAIFDKSKLYHVDLQYGLDKVDHLFDTLIVGGTFRIYDPESNGTIFTDSIGNNVTNRQFGLFGQMTKEISPNTDLTASLSFDKNENFEGKLSKRLSVVHQLDIHYFRASLLQGFRLPSMNEQFLNQNIGDKRVVGGLKSVSDQYDLHNNSFLINSLNEYNNQLIDKINLEELEFEALKLDLLPVLEEGIIRDGQFTGLKPEKVTSFEFGYRSLLEGKRLFELTFYRNYYRNFIGNIRVIKPRTSPSIDLVRAAEQINNPASSDVIFVKDNSEDQVITQGLDLLYDYSANSGTYFKFNLSFADIKQASNDPVTPGFNTTPFKFNMSVGHRRITENFGAEITWRWRSDYQWQSPFGDGFVRDFGTFDLQLTMRLPEIHSQIRFGGNNMYNIDQYNTFGGAEINAFYYLSFVYDPFQVR